VSAAAVALMHVRIVRADGSRAGLARLLGLRIVLPAIVTAVPFAGGVFASSLGRSDPSA